MQNASAYVRELFAVTEAIKKWRQYLIGRKFQIFTDHQSLKHLISQTIQTPEQQRWAYKLQGYEFKVIYKPGRMNKVADALSRQYDEDKSILLAISSPIPAITVQF